MLIDNNNDDDDDDDDDGYLQIGRWIPSRAVERLPFLPAYR